MVYRDTGRKKNRNYGHTTYRYNGIRYTAIPEEKNSDITVDRSLFNEVRGQNVLFIHTHCNGVYTLQTIYISMCIVLNKDILVQIGNFLPALKAHIGKKSAETAFFSKIPQFYNA